ncbi:unnamed protein product [Lymnaea stagnalis]|uniref:C1q domain-containing protein n=1 Tax=Lymnaea stagnalis TaxID=6523 RepID=A0AAV2HY40_LYMST
MLQQSITFIIAKSVELSGLHNRENDNEQTPNSVPNVHHLTSPTVKYKPGAEPSDMMPRTKQSMHGGGAVEAHTSHIFAMRLGILEEAVFSLKMTTDKIQEKQENIDHTSKDVSIQQENVDKAVEVFNKTNLKFKKQIEETITELKKKSNEISSNVDHLFETVANIDNRLNRLDEENESVNSVMNEVNRQFTCFERCSSDALISLQDLSKSVESTNQHYDEMSNKMNKLQISMDLMSSQYTEQFENMGGLNKDKVDDLHVKVDAVTRQALDLSNQVTVIKSKCCLPNVGFYAFKKLNHTDGRHELQNFEIVNGNYGNHFDPKSGKFAVPLSGLYLMSITAKLAEKSSISVLHYQQREIEVCTLLGKQTITCCCELKGGDNIGLKLSVKEEKTQTWVDFSCCLVNAY